MAELTPSDLKASLKSRGVSMSDVELNGIICLVSSISECLDANYTDDCVKSSIMLYAGILLSVNSAGRYVTSHSSPSGASQSFSYGSKPWLALYNQMKLFDKAGCTGDLVEDPTGGAKPFFGTVSGSRRCR